MTPRARVAAAIAQEPVDRPPGGAWGHTYREEWSPADLAAVTAARARKFSWDFVKFQPRAGCFAEAFGASYRSANHRLRAPVPTADPILQKVEDWAEVSGSADSPALADQVEAIRLTCADLGRAIPVLQTVFSPVTVAGYLAGRDGRRVIRELRDHGEVVKPALARIAEVMVEFAKRSVGAGAAGVFYAVSSGYAGADMMTEEFYRSHVLPTDRLVLDALNGTGWFNVVHLCGSRLHFDLVNEFPPPVASWSISNRGNPSLAEGRARTRKAVMGGLRHRTTMVRGPLSAIAEETRAAAAVNGGVGVLVAPGCSVPPAAPDANLAAMMEALG